MVGTTRCRVQTATRHCKFVTQSHRRHRLAPYRSATAPRQLKARDTLLSSCKRLRPDTFTDISGHCSQLTVCSPTKNVGKVKPPAPALRAAAKAAKEIGKGAAHVGGGSRLCDHQITDECQMADSSYPGASYHQRASCTLPRSFELGSSLPPSVVFSCKFPNAF